MLPSPRVRLVGAWVVAVAALTVLAWPSWDTVVDDAFISARYADHLAEGWGLVYNAGEPPVEGYTNLLWTVLLALGRLAGLPMHPLLTWLGWVFAALALGAAVLLTRTLVGRDSLVTALPAGLLASSPYLWISSTNGLESSMMLALVLGALWAHLALKGSARWGAGLLAGAVILCRPEGAVVAGLIVFDDLARHRSRPAAALPVSGTAVAVLGALLAFRMAVYGHPLPNTFYAKSGFPITETFQVNRAYLGPRSGSLIAGAVALGLGCVLPPWSRARALVAVAGVALAVIPLSVDLWMPGLRLFLPPLGIATVLVATSVAALPRKWLRATAATALLVATALHARAVAPRELSYDRHHSVVQGNDASLAGLHLAAHAPEGAWLATRDAGVLAYYVGTGIRVAELHQRALTQPHPGGRNLDVLASTPIDPTVVVVTFRDPRASRPVYRGDEAVLKRTGVPYRYDGRVHQHHRRYYDLYVRADSGIPPVPDELVTSRAGLPAPVEVSP